MVITAPVTKLNKFLNPDERFIFGVDGNLKQVFIYDALYSLFPYAFFNYFPYTIFEITTNSILAVTDKRIMVLEKDSEGNVDDKHMYSYNYNEVSIEFKKKLGKRIFIIEKIKKKYFSFQYEIFTIEIDSSCIKQADYIYDLLSVNNMLKKPGA